MIHPVSSVARLLSAIFAMAIGSAVSAAAGPNIIMVFIDDMGWSDLSSFGGAEVKTTHLDRLANEGIRFTRFYVNSPLCSPSRVALATGQYPQRWRISSYLDHRARNEARGMAQWLDPAAPVLARQLALAGYATGHFGKWHMGGQRDVGDAPPISAYGFERSLTNFEGLGPRVLPLCDSNDGKPPKKHDLGSAALGGGPIYWEPRSRVTSSFVKETIGFIDGAIKGDRPFYVNVWPDDVHSPFFPAAAGPFPTKRFRYLAVLGEMDAQLAPLFDRVRNDPKIRDNTLILCASDNGPEPGAGSSLPLRAGKGVLYEGGIRSPLIVWGPGLMHPRAAGSTNTTAVLSSIDLNRSVYAITGAPLPEAWKPDGEDVADVLLGKVSQGRRAPLFWRRPPDRPDTDGSPNPDLAMLDGRWKCYMSYNGKVVGLYDVESDCSEGHDVAEQHPGTVAKFLSAMRAWDATLPRDAGSGPRH